METDLPEDLWKPRWNAIRDPKGPLTRALRRVASSAVFTYAAYTAYGLRHPHLLRSNASPAERDLCLPGDEIVARPNWVTNFVTEIAASPAEVWPWLLQLGYGRAGWYTWYPLDNGGRQSPAELVNGLQALKVGDVIPDGPRAAEGYGVWKVQTLDQHRAMVLVSRRNPLDGHEVSDLEAEAEPHIDCSWAFVLNSLSARRTRLHVRVRARFVAAAGGDHRSALANKLGQGRGKLAVKLGRWLFGYGDSVWEHSFLAGLRWRAERLSAKGGEVVYIPSISSIATKGTRT